MIGGFNRVGFKPVCVYAIESSSRQKKKKTNETTKKKKEEREEKRKKRKEKIPITTCFERLGNTRSADRSHRAQTCRVNRGGAAENTRRRINLDFVPSPFPPPPIPFSLYRGEWRPASLGRLASGARRVK